MMMMMMRRRRRRRSRDDQQIGRRPCRATVRDRSRGVPSVPLTTPLLLTVRDVHVSTLTTTMMTVMQGRLLVLAGLVVSRTSTRMTSRGTRSEFVDSFFFSLLFYACCQRGRKLEWSITFSTPCACCRSFMSYLMRVSHH
jgi:hypothetical protein